MVLKLVVSALLLATFLQPPVAAAQAGWSGTATLNFDSITGTGCIDATSYLGGFGVTVTQPSGGTIVSAGAAGQCFHGDVVVPSSPKALYVLNNQPVRFSLNFDRAMVSVRFVRARLNAGASGVNTVGWTATAYSETGAALDEVREDAGSAYRPDFIAAATYTLSGNGIRSVTFVRTNPRGQNTDFGVSFPVLDDLVLTELAVQTTEVIPADVRGWSVVDGPDRMFSVAMPAAPTHEISPSGTSHRYMLAFEDRAYVAFMSTLPPGSIDPRAILKEQLTSYARSLRSGAWATTTWTTFDGAQAVEATGMDNEGAEMRSFLVLKGRRLYWLRYLGPVGTMRSEDTNRFFNSLRISP